MKESPEISQDENGNWLGKEFVSLINYFVSEGRVFTDIGLTVAVKIAYFESTWDSQTEYTVDRLLFLSDLFSFLIDSVSYSCRYPLGVIGIVTSWASPLHSVLWHAIPALACGNCVIIKPSCLAPIEIHLLAKTFSDAGN